MDASIAQMSTVSEAMQEVLSQRAKEVERSTGFVQRSTAVLDGPMFAQMTTLTWMHNAQAGYSQLQHTAASLGVNVSAQAIAQRFSEASVAGMRERSQAEQYFLTQAKASVQVRDGKGGGATCSRFCVSILRGQ